jgi:hypothetical protein
MRKRNLEPDAYDLLTKPNSTTMLLAKLNHYAAHETEMRKRNLEPDAYDLASVLSLCANGTQFTCFTSTKKKSANADAATYLQRSSRVYLLY